MAYRQYKLFYLQHSAGIVSWASNIHNPHQQPEVACITHKFVDDTTLSDMLDRGAACRTQQFIDELLE
jgi:hypothetical protein